MSGDDDIERIILRGDAYEQASTLEDQLFGVTVDKKIYICVLALLSSGLLAPLLYLGRRRIERFEGTQTLAETLSPALSTLALFGVLTTFVFGLALIRLLVSIRSQSLSTEEARRIVRIEDLFMFFAAVGILSIATALFLATVGASSADVTERLYDSGVAVYSTDGPVSVDSRVVSGLGVVFAVVLYALTRNYRKKPHKANEE